MTQYYTDGSYNIGRDLGGWAFVAVNEGELIFKKSEVGISKSTNNRMEMIAAIEALKDLKFRGGSGRIYTDSKYLKYGVETWIKTWKNNGWKTAKGKFVKNKDLWEQLDVLYSTLSVSIIWIKGHSGDEWNDLVDELAGDY